MNQNGKKGLIGLAVIIGSVVLLHPIAIHFLYQESWGLPEGLANYCRAVTGLDLPLVYLFIVLVLLGCLYVRTNGGAAMWKEIYKESNLDASQFDQRPEQFAAQLKEICSYLAEDKDNTPVTNAEFAKVIRYRGFVIASEEGNMVDYFCMEAERVSHSLRVFLLGASHTKNKAVKTMFDQGMTYLENHEKWVEFQSDEFHLHASFEDGGGRLRFLEVCRGDVPSRMEQLLAENEGGVQGEIKRIYREKERLEREEEEFLSGRRLPFDRK